jgi:hypothetical protein
MTGDNLLTNDKRKHYSKVSRVEGGVKRNSFEQEQTERTEKLLTISVSSVASCKEVTSDEGRVSSEEGQEQEVGDVTEIFSREYAVFSVLSCLNFSAPMR